MKYFITSIRCLVVLTILTGLIYPGLVTVLAQILFTSQANGSLVKNQKGLVVGSELIAQEFKNERYFWPRPSAIAYNPLPSGGSNLGPTSKVLQEAWCTRRKAGFTGDMLAASASGLDPHISPESALAQIARVAHARGRSDAELKQLVMLSIEGKELGFLGEERVNVLRLNLLLDEKMP